MSCGVSGNWLEGPAPFLSSARLASRLASPPPLAPRLCSKHPGAWRRTPFSSPSTGSNPLQAEKRETPWVAVLPAATGRSRTSLTPSLASTVVSQVRRRRLDETRLSPAYLTRRAAQRRPSPSPGLHAALPTLGDEAKLLKLRRAWSPLTTLRTRYALPAPSPSLSAALVPILSARPPSLYPLPLGAPVKAASGLGVGLAWLPDAAVVFCLCCCSVLPSLPLLPFLPSCSRMLRLLPPGRAFLSPSVPSPPLDSPQTPRSAFTMPA